VAATRGFVLQPAKASAAFSTCEQQLVCDQGIFQKIQSAPSRVFTATFDIRFPEIRTMGVGDASFLMKSSSRGSIQERDFPRWHNTNPKSDQVETPRRAPCPRCAGRHDRKTVVGPPRQAEAQAKEASVMGRRHKQQVGFASRQIVLV